MPQSKWNKVIGRRVTEGAALSQVGSQDPFDLRLSDKKGPAILKQVESNDLWDIQGLIISYKSRRDLGIKQKYIFKISGKPTFAGVV
jgi:hypothetical protein